jgi:hypothetical protein
MYVTYVLANNNSKTIKEYFIIKQWSTKASPWGRRITTMTAPQKKMT